MKIVLTVLKKELWESLRDPMVVILSLGFPILFFPLIMWGTTQAILLTKGVNDNEPPRIHIVGVQAPGPGGIVDALQADPAVPTVGTDQDLRQGDLDLIAEVEMQGASMRITLHHNSTLPRSQRAVQWAEDQLDEVREARERELAIKSGLDPESLNVWKIESTDMALKRNRELDILASIMPVAMLIMLLMSTVIPSVDIFVGERERGTLETSMVTTRSRWPLILGKVLAASTIGLIGVTGNLFAGSLSVVQTMMSIFGNELSPPEVSIRSVLLSIPPLFSCAVLLCAATFAAVLPSRTFKQAQATSSFVFIAGIVATMSVDVEEEMPQLWTAALPLRNLAHSISGAFRGTLTLDYAVLSTTINLALASILILLVQRIMQHEGYLFGPENSGWKDAAMSLLPQRWSQR